MAKIKPHAEAIRQATALWEKWVVESKDRTRSTSRVIEVIARAVEEQGFENCHAALTAVLADDWWMGRAPVDQYRDGRRSRVANMDRVFGVGARERLPDWIDRGHQIEPAARGEEPEATPTSAPRLTLDDVWERQARLQTSLCTWLWHEAEHVGWTAADQDHWSRWLGDLRPMAGVIHEGVRFPRFPFDDDSPLRGINWDVSWLLAIHAVELDPTFAEVRFEIARVKAESFRRLTVKCRDLAHRVADEPTPEDLVLLAGTYAD